MLTNLLSRTRQKQGYKPSASSGVLSLEPLENRVLLTTLVLPKGEEGTVSFVYSDPEETDGTNIGAYNVLRIGTLSGYGPTENVVVEILGYDYLTDTGVPRTVDIPGTIIHADDTEEDIGGGPGGGPIFSLLAETGYEVSALATDSSGVTFGLTSAGQLIRYNIAGGEADSEVVAQIVDTDNTPSGLENITFEEFYSADFAYVDMGDGNEPKEVIYAVVNAPLISDTGLISGEGPVLITIDPVTGEAEPVASVGGRPSYSLSNIAQFETNPDTNEQLPAVISTMVFSEENHNASVDTTSPVFIAYNQTSNRYITMSVTVNPITGDTSLAYRNITAYDEQVDDGVVVSGLAYCDYNSDGDSDLFATVYTLGDDGARTEGRISLVTFTNLSNVNLGNHAYTDVVALDQHANDGYDRQDRLFTGFTFDEVGQVGYASEDFTGMLYQVNLANLVYENNEFSMDGNHDIYMMYIKSSTPDVYITITRATGAVDNLSYTSTAGDTAYLYTDEDNAEVFAPDNSGGVSIGTHAYNHTENPDEITYDALTFYTEPGETAPAPGDNYGGVWKNGEYRPGIIVEEGNDVGLISIGGAVYGDVVVKDGSIGTFYCGFLGANNFYVNGDLQNLIVGTEAGGVNESDGFWSPALSTISYYGSGQSITTDMTTTFLDVQGRMGSFYSVGDWGMPIRVWGNEDVSSFPGIYDYIASDSTYTDDRVVGYYDVFREMEMKVGAQTPVSIDFSYGAFDWIFNNDTAEAAQYLGTRRSDGIISVVGGCESSNYDASDFYSFGVLAGDEVSIKLFSTGGTLNSDTGIPAYPGASTVLGSNVVLYDANGIQIETAGEVDPLNNNYIVMTFVADIAGVYTVEVTGSSSYRLDIAGVSETTLGGGTTLANMRSNYAGAVRDASESDARPIIQVMEGNLGAVNVNGHAALPQVRVFNGDIKAARFNGTEDQGFGYTSIGVEIDDSGSGYAGVEPMIYASGYVGEVRVAGMSIVNVYAGEDLQSLYAVADIACGLYINDDIGSIYVGGSYIDDTNGVVMSYIFANADGDKDPGIIDSIIVGGTMQAYVSTGRYESGNQIRSGAGNVRFVDIGGGADAGTDGLVTEWVYDNGQSAVISDDSGAMVVLSPGYEGVLEEVENDDGTTTMDNITGGILTVRILPIFDILPSDIANTPFAEYPTSSHVIVSVSSTDGLRITTKNGAPVEIGRVVVEGAYDDAIRISGSAPISIYRIEAQAPEEPATDTGEDTETEEEVDGNIPGITTIVNTSGWYLDQNNTVYTGRSGQKKTTWVGGDLLSVIIGEPDTGASEEAAADTTTERLYAVSTVSVRGNLGLTATSTGQAIYAPLVFAAVDQATTPGGDMYNGLYSLVSVDSIRVAGRIANDLYVSASVDSIVVNTDNSVYADQFDGIAAAVVVRGDLDGISVGDGLLDPGTGFWADAGIFVSGNIGTVKATGVGHDIAGAILSEGAIGTISVTNGADLIGYNYTGGWNCPSIATYTTFDSFYIANDGITYGSVAGETALGQVLVKGKGSEIVGALILTGSCNKVVVSGGAEGMTTTAIYLNAIGSQEAGSINSINVCGYGIRDCYIVAGYNAKSISVTKGGDIAGTIIATSWKLGSITADNIIDTQILGSANNINTIGSIVARESISKLSVSAGTINLVSAKDDILDSTIYVTSRLNNLKTGDDLVSEIVVAGPYGILGNVTVGGDMGRQNVGSLAVDGTINSIKVKGNLYSSLYLNESSPYFAGDAYKGDELKSITVGGLMQIDGVVYGDIGTIKTGGNLGVSGAELNVHGDVRSVIVGGGVRSELKLDLTVDGDLGSVKTTGDIEGDIVVTGNLGKVTVGRSVKEASGEHGINGDITVGGDLGSVLVKNGDVNGALNVEGQTGTIKTVGCGVYGDGVYQGNTAGLSLTGSLDSMYVVDGDVKSIKLTGGYNNGVYEEGSLLEDGAILIDGNLGSLYVSDDILGTVYVTGNIGTIYVGGDISGASIVVGGNIGKVVVVGAMTDDESDNQSLIVAGYDPGSGGTINANDFTKLGTGKSAYRWEELDWTGQPWADPAWEAMDWSDSAVVDAMQGDVLAAYTEYLMKKFTIEGDAVDPTEAAYAGNIGSVAIKTFKNSSIVAGVAPGSDGKYGDLDGTDTAGTGSSSIGSVTLTAQPSGSSTDVYGIFADGEIGKLKVDGGALTIPVLVNPTNGFRAWEVAAVEEFDLEARPGTQLMSFEAGDPLTYTYGAGTINFKLSGNGRALVQIETATGNVVAMQLKDTDARSSVIVTTKNIDDLEIGRIFSNDDCSLKNLFIDGTLVYSEDGSSLEIDGGINNVRLNGIDATGGEQGDEMLMNIGGSVGTLQVGEILADSDTNLELSIQGKLGSAVFGSVSTDVYLSVDSLNSLQVRDDFEGNLSSDSLINSVVIKGDFDGLIFADGNINKVTVKGQMGAIRLTNRPEATLAAFGDIKSVATGSMINASIVAGGSLYSAKVSGDMTGSDIVAGVILDKFTSLRDGELEVAEGDVRKVLVTGDFLESNIAAGIAPGIDGYYSTTDDELSYRLVEKYDAPTIEAILPLKDGSGTDINTIVIKFADIAREDSSNIMNVNIKGTIQNGQWDSLEYALIAAGQIEKVIVHGQRYSGSDQVNLKEVNSRSLNSATINRTLATMDDVANSAIWIQVDGMDQRFDTPQEVFAGLSDDSFVYGEDVTVLYDEASNSIRFNAPDGLLASKEGANYYKVILRSGLVKDLAGVALDGEYTGEMPTGNSLAGGDFIYCFAVADVGDLVTTAFTPFDEENGFPSNYFWKYSSTVGDDRSYTGAVSMFDNDYYKLTNLEGGQILCINLSDLNAAGAGGQFVSDWYSNIIVEVLKIEEHDDFNNYGLSSVIDTTLDTNQTRPLVSSEMAEMFWSGSNFYGYDDEGGIFYRIEVISTNGNMDTAYNTFEMLNNDIVDINSKIRSQGVIEHLSALGGHADDSFWAIAEFTPTGGTTRESLVLIKNLERDVDVNQSESLEVYISDEDLSDYNIVGLTETTDYTGEEDLNILYAVSADGRMYQLNSDIKDSLVNDIGNDDIYFGQIKRYFNGQETVRVGNRDVIMAAPLKDNDGEDIDGFNITGMSIAREGDGLYILHDLTKGDYSTFRDDAIYKVTFDTDDDATANYWLELNNDYDYEGLAANPDGYVMTGVPMYGTPIGDTISVSFGSDIQEMVFGSDDALALRGGLVNITSDPEQLSVNYESYAFVQNDMYYGFSIDYNTDLTNELVITIENIDFWMDRNGRSIRTGSMVDYAYSDNQYVTVAVNNVADDMGNISTSLIVTIDAAYADGEANIYFSADSGQVLTFSEFSMDEVGEIIGSNAREATTGVDVRHDMILPNLSELTVSSVDLATAVTLNAGDVLKYNLQRYLSESLYNQLDGLLSDDTLNDVADQLASRPALYADFQRALVYTQYNSLGYDSEQQVFALVNSDSFECRPIIVEAPRANANSNDDSVESVELTLDSLSRIFNRDNKTSSTTWTIDNISALEFGEVQVIPGTGGEADIERPVLWAIATITKETYTQGTGTEIETTQNLIRIDNILEPDNILVSLASDLQDQGYTGITELACGVFASGTEAEEILLSGDKNELYGFDTVSNTLVKFDIDEYVIDVNSTTQIRIANPDFGQATEIGQINSVYDIADMDFDGSGRLLAIDDAGNSIIQISTKLNAGTDRTSLLEYLADGDYAALTFDSQLYNSVPILIRNATGTVVGDGIQVRVGQSDWTSHVFGSATSTSAGGVTLSSVSGTDTVDGFYSMALTYTVDQGDVVVELDGIDWRNGLGQIDSVEISDRDNITIIDYDENSISLLIDTDSGLGQAELYFGTTSDVLRPGLGYTTATPVYKSSVMSDGTIELYQLIEEDGDYVIRVGLDFTDSLYDYLYSDETGLFVGGVIGEIPNTPVEYDLEVCAFNDGDSDFGDVVISDGSFYYESGKPDDAAVDLSSTNDQWSVDDREDDFYKLDNRSSRWNMYAKGDFIVPGQESEITVYSELAFGADVDVYSVQLTEGQKLSVDLNCTMYGGAGDIMFLVGVYNSDLEAVASILTQGDDIAVIDGEADLNYTIQAINTIEGSSEIIDPMQSVNGVLTGTYYVVVSLLEAEDGLTEFGDATYYSMTLTTSVGGADQIKYQANPQLVYLSFGNKITGKNEDADYLAESFAGQSYGDIAERPAFSLDSFANLPDSFTEYVNGVPTEVAVDWDYMVERITERVCQVYQEALDDPDTAYREDLDFIKITSDSSEIVRAGEHSTVVIGGDFSELGVAGIADGIDRHNADHSDMACVASDFIGWYYNQYIDDDVSSPSEIVDRAVSAVAGTIIHELGHILGLEHSTEVNPDLTYPVGSAAVYEPDNVMNYNPVSIDMAGSKFEERNAMASVASGYFSYTVNQPGFQNEIDSLLRNLGTVAPTM